MNTFYESRTECVWPNGRIGIHYSVNSTEYYPTEHHSVNSMFIYCQSLSRLEFPSFCFLPACSFFLLSLLALFLLPTSSPYFSLFHYHFSPAEYPLFPFPFDLTRRFSKVPPELQAVQMFKFLNILFIYSKHSIGHLCCLFFLF